MKYRTHTCGQLRAYHVGERVRLAGWIHRKRQFGGMLFVDLRDHYGVTQIVFKSGKEASGIDELGLESVVSIIGSVVAREPSTINEKLLTGEVEMLAESFYALSVVENLPMPVTNRSEGGEPEQDEETRLRYRYVDLRKQRLHNNIVLRSKVIRELREQMQERDFLEIQTPILTASSPEGARDYLVPSRLHAGKFYALPQAPQMFKQLLMVGGFDRYFQIAPCFRDEAGRSDRSPGEFYQLDFEMAFVDQETVFETIEPVLASVFEKFGGGKSVTPSPFPRISYKEAMLKFGCDKPDLRNPLVAVDTSSAFDDPAFFRHGSMPEGGIARALVVPPQSRGFTTKVVSACNINEGSWYAPIEVVTFSSQKEVSDGLRALHCLSEPDSTVFLVYGEEHSVNRQLAVLRDELGKRLDLIDENRFAFCWVVDFPMFEQGEDGKIDFSHNPFSMPQGGMEALLTKNPLDILAYQYDIVCNGVELSSGAIRNHLPEVMYSAFEIAGYSKDHVDEKFSGMINAFKCGAPPHGGSAPGVDRIVMLLANEPNIREVIAFPMNQQAEDLMMGAPSFVSDMQLKDLGYSPDNSPFKEHGQ